MSWPKDKHRKPINELNQPYVDAIADFLTKSGISKREFIATIYGRDVNTMPNSVGANIYQIMAGTVSPGIRVKNRILGRTGLNLLHINHKRATPVRNAVMAYEAAKSNGQTTILEPIKKLPPKFNMVIHTDGSADVSCNLTRLSTIDALRFIAILTDAKFLHDNEKSP